MLRAVRCYAVLGAGGEGRIGVPSARPPRTCRTVVSNGATWALRCGEALKAAGHDQDLAGHPAGVVRGKKHHGGGHVARMPCAAKWRLLRRVLFEIGRA